MPRHSAGGGWKPDNSQRGGGPDACSHGGRKDARAYAQPGSDTHQCYTRSRSRGQGVRCHSSCNEDDALLRGCPRGDECVCRSRSKGRDANPETGDSRVRSCHPQALRSGQRLLDMPTGAGVPRRHRLPRRGSFRIELPSGLGVRAARRGTRHLPLLPKFDVETPLGTLLSPMASAGAGSSVGQLEPVWLGFPCRECGSPQDREHRARLLVRRAHRRAEALLLVHLLTPSESDQLPQRSRRRDALPPLALHSRARLRRRCAASWSR
jgi:hypothetical protein